MDLRELYDRIGGNYDEALKRLAMDKLVARFVVKLPDDPSVPALLDAWAAGDETAAFESAHAAKGVWANLSIASVADRASLVCEALRPGNEAQRAQVDIDAELAQLKADYEVAAAAIREYAAQA